MRAAAAAAVAPVAPRGPCCCFGSGGGGALWVFSVGVGGVAWGWGEVFLSRSKGPSKH